MDLDINNYEYDDILKLFNISNNFNEEDLKAAKKWYYPVIQINLD